MSLHIKEFLSIFSAYENRLENMSFNNISKFETEMKEHEDILNTKIDTKIYDLKYEASSSINKKLSPLNSNNPPSSYKKPSSDINKLPLLKSPDFHSHPSQFTKHISPMTLEGDTLLKLKKWWYAIHSAF